MVRMALKLWKLTLEPYQSFSENDAPGYGSKSKGFNEIVNSAYQTLAIYLQDSVVVNSKYQRT